jgi:hypothetical protein
MARPSLTPAVARPTIITDRALRRLVANLALRLEPIHRQPRAADAVLGTIDALLEEAESNPCLIDETLPLNTANRFEPGAADASQARTSTDPGFSLGELIGGLLTDAMFHRDDAAVTASRIRTFFLQAADSARRPKSAPTPAWPATDAESGHG